ncbi:MAG: macro domain-containing protein [Clostridia bacterium]|nr:macro domain-containing protein [Clostridia bacterium]
MPFTIIRNDITRMAVDAIVNSAAPHLLGGGGADGEIHRVAGPELAKACRKLGGCKPGQVKLTEGYGLPCRYVIHTVGPMWMGGLFGEEETLRHCYRNALQLAREKGLETIAFPLISSGIFAYPREKALRIATEEIGDFVLQNDLMVYLVVYDRESFRIGSKLQQDIQQFIDDRYVKEHGQSRDFSAFVPPSPREAARPFSNMLWNQPVSSSEIEQNSQFEEDALPMGEPPVEDWGFPDLGHTADMCCEAVPFAGSWYEEEHEANLRSLLSQQDESFTQRLLRLIDESGMTDPECYRRANIDRRLFSKIRNNPHYQPSKQTALAFAVALRLDRSATEQLLQTAGLALSRSNKFDIIVEYCLTHGIYDIHQVNGILYNFDQITLGV